VAYAAGLCDAISAPARSLHALRKTLPEPSLNRILPERISKDPLGPMVRNDDDVWGDIVRWTLFALINAEELGINSMNLDTMLEVKARPIHRFLGTDADFKLGVSLGLDRNWMLNVIRAVGNYGEMYDRNFGSQTGVPLPRGLNSLWTKGGLIYAPPTI
jgi:general L-amino acid transport system substrate-binding protein